MRASASRHCARPTLVAAGKLDEADKAARKMAEGPAERGRADAWPARDDRNPARQRRSGAGGSLADVLWNPRREHGAGTADRRRPRRGRRGAEGPCCAAHQRPVVWFHRGRACIAQGTRPGVRVAGARSRTTKTWPGTCSRVRSLHLIDATRGSPRCANSSALPVAADAVATQ